MAYRATRTEPRVAVGPWTMDLEKGKVYPVEAVPDFVADHLLGHQLLVEVADDAQDNPWFDSEDPELNGGVENDQLHGPLRSNIKDMRA